MNPMKRFLHCMCMRKVTRNSVDGGAYLFFTRVEQYPNCKDHAFLRGKPFGGSLKK